MTDRSFEEMDKRIDDLDYKFNEVDDRLNRIDDRLNGLDERLDETNKNLVEMKVEFNERFNGIDDRLNGLDERLDETNKSLVKMSDNFNDRLVKMSDNFNDRFDNLDRLVSSLLTAFGKPFEQFGRNVITRILSSENIDADIKYKKIRHNFPDMFENLELEIDGFCEEPPIIAEITSILRDIEKIEKFIQKKKVVEKIYGKEFRGFFVSGGSEFDEKKRKRIIELLEKNNIELINL